MKEKVRIWSIEHNAWWKQNGLGYTRIPLHAGLFERTEAERIVSNANYGGVINEEIREVESPAADVEREGK